LPQPSCHRLMTAVRFSNRFPRKGWKCNVYDPGVPSLASTGYVKTYVILKQYIHTHTHTHTNTVSCLLATGQSIACVNIHRGNWRQWRPIRFQSASSREFVVLWPRGKEPINNPNSKLEYHQRSKPRGIELY
jgi:hypothetical protein